MAFIKNREKFAKEIMDIACSGSGIAMKGGVLVPCDGLRCTLRCTECDFSSLIPSTNNKSCDISVKEWCESEYVEPSIDWSKIEVNTPIMVRDKPNGEWLRRYFAKYKDGIVFAFNNGGDSWSSCYECTSWNFAKLAEKEDYVL